MATAQQLIALVKSYVEGNEDKFLSVAMQAAAKEARQGHGKVAQQLRDLVDKAKQEQSALVRRAGVHPTPVLRDELATLLSVSYPDHRLSSMVLVPSIEEKLLRILHEQRQQDRLRSFGLQPRRKLLFVGPPGSGKTMTASVLAGELRRPLFTIRLDGVITKFMGETAAKLRQIFEAMNQTIGIYLFDEFDAIGSNRRAPNDIGEVRRILNSFLQFLENDESQSIIIAATNHPDLLDQALFRRFDDLIRYEFPDSEISIRILKSHLTQFNTDSVEWGEITQAVQELSQAEIARAADEAAKEAVLQGHTEITTRGLLLALAERRQANL
ncbi:MAG TPA: ATP-binding protein [Trueperaceae bacterium]